MQKTAKHIAQSLLQYAQKKTTNGSWTKPFIEENTFYKFAQNLSLIHNNQFIDTLQTPKFKEELIPDRERIFSTIKKHLEQVITKACSNEAWEGFFKTISEQELLIVLGMRFTPASLKTLAAIPPSKKTLLTSALQPFNSQVSQAVRAWEKHVGRNNTDFWGEVKGNAAYKETFVRNKLQTILTKATWWNTFVHYKHDIVYEFRVTSGHGVRWKQENLQFLGCLEPFLDE